MNFDRLREVPIIQAQHEEIERLRAENQKLRDVCRNVYEVWAGSEGVPEPETCAEGYLLRLVEQMRDEAKKGLR